MLRPIALADSIRISLMKGSNWAGQPAAAASAGGRASFSGMSFLRRHLQPRGKEVAWIATKGGRITSLVSAIPASGNTAWRIDHMVVGEEDIAAALLGKVTAEAGAQGAERVLLNIPDEWHIMDSASRGGFRPGMEIRALTLSGRAALIGEEFEAGCFRPRTPVDDVPLFDLYRRATPPEARFAMGLTMSQWKDSQEPYGRGTEERVLVDGKDGIAAWVRLDRERGRVRVRLTVDPSWEGDSRSLIAFVLEETGSRSIWWEVPGHQESLGSLLEQIGLETAGVYHLMVKALAAHVEAPEIVPAHAAYG